jgi:hypothetical protein
VTDADTREPDVDSEETASTVLDEGTPANERPGVVPHSTPGESTARGKAARSELPRSAHGAWEPAPMRRDPVDLLENYPV